MNDPYRLLTAEEKLLLSLCRLSFTPEQKNQISLLMKEVKDWDHFVDLSNKHGIIALCWNNLTETGNSSLIPSRQLKLMQSAYLKNLSRNTFIYRHLKEIASLTEKENIKIVLLKGVALEKTVYGNKGLRQMNDIDILVRQDKAALLRRIFLKNGYESAPLVSCFHEKIMPAYGKHLPEMYKNGVSVEIHFKLFDQKGNSLTEEFYNKAAILPDQEIDFYHPDPQLFFLYLIKHLEKHEKSGTSQLRLYTDLVGLLSFYSDQIINTQLFEQAIHANLRNALAEKLILLNIFWSISLPEQVNLTTERLKSQPSEAKFIRFLRNNSDFHQEEKQRTLLKLLKDVPGTTNRLLLIFGHIFPSFAYMKYRYNTNTETKSVLYYPVRWIRQIILLLKKLRD